MFGCKRCRVKIEVQSISTFNVADRHQIPVGTLRYPVYACVAGGQYRPRRSAACESLILPTRLERYYLIKETQCRSPCNVHMMSAGSRSVVAHIRSIFGRSSLIRCCLTARCIVHVRDHLEHALVSQPCGTQPVRILASLLAGLQWMSSSIARAFYLDYRG